MNSANAYLKIWINLETYAPIAGMFHQTTCHEREPPWFSLAFPY